jgi:hypothetical protein
MIRAVIPPELRDGSGSAAVRKYSLLIQQPKKELRIFSNTCVSRAKYHRGKAKQQKAKQKPPKNHKKQHLCVDFVSVHPYNKLRTNII